MLKIHQANRVEIEKEYLALLLNKPELFTIVQIKSDYLTLPANKNIFEYAKECVEENDCLDTTYILEKHPNIDFDYLIELLNDTFYFNSAWKEQLKLSEGTIVKFYKEDVIKRLNERLDRSEIKYEEFMKQMKRLDEIILIENTITLTKNEVIESMTEERAKINFNNFEKLNRTLEMVRGDFLIIGATTGAGKSSFMLNLMNDLMTGFQCIYFNMEMSKSTIYKRIVSINSNIPMEDILNPKSEHQKQKIEEAYEKIENANLIIEHKANDIKQIKSTLLKLKDKTKHTILFIDHLGLTRTDNQRSLYEQATEVAKELRQMCLEHDCTVISASQLNRSAYTSDEISLSMLKDSGELENSASKVILLSYDKDTNRDNPVVKMKVNIVKNRDGRVGYIDMKYDKTKQVFSEVTDYGN